MEIEKDTWKPTNQSKGLNPTRSYLVKDLEITTQLASSRVTIKHSELKEKEMNGD